MYILNRSNFIDLQALLVCIDLDFTRSIKIAYTVYVIMLAYCFSLVSFSIEKS